YRRLSRYRAIPLQRRADEQLRMAATVFDHSTAAIVITDAEGGIIKTNEAFSHITGYGAEEVIGQLPSVLGADRQQENQLGFILNRIRQQGSWEGEVWLKRKDGETDPGCVGITGVRDQQAAL